MAAMQIHLSHFAQLETFYSKADSLFLITSTQKIGANCSVTAGGLLINRPLGHVIFKRINFAVYKNRCLLFVYEQL